MKGASIYRDIARSAGLHGITLHRFIRRRHGLLPDVVPCPRIVQVARHHVALRYSTLGTDLSKLNPEMWLLGGIVQRKDNAAWEREKQGFPDSYSPKWGLFLSEHPAWTKGDFKEFKPPDDDDSADQAPGIAF